MTTETKPDAMPVVGGPNSKPDVNALLKEYKTCSPWSRSGWNRVRTNEDVRFNRGAGHTPDCRKHGSPTNPAFPWDGASNQKSFMADGLIGEITDFLVIAFWRSWMTPKAGTSAVSNYAVKLLDWIVNTECTDQLETDVELSASYLQTYGWVGLHPRWEFEIALERKIVTLEELTGIAQALSARLDEQGGSMAGAPPPLLGLLNLPALIADMDLEGPAIEALDLAWQGYAMQQVGRSDVSLPHLSRATLRTAVRELRETGQADIPVPYVCRNQPAFHALKPWEELLIPNNATDVDRTPAFRVDWLSEVDLRAKQLTEDWDPGWIAEAIKHKGKFSAWNYGGMMSGAPGTELNGRLSAGMDSVFEPADTKTDLIEVVYATYRMVDADGVVGVYLTIFHPLVGKESGTSTPSSYAWHGLLPSTRGRSPYIIGKREHVARTITSSRGLPEILQSYQDSAKIQVDGAMDWTSIGVLPPINEYATAIKTTYKYGPAVRNTVQQGKEPKFMEVPGHGVPVAFEMLERIETWVDRYAGRKNPNLPPDIADMRSQKRVTSFLLMWTRALLRGVDLCQDRMEDALFSEITGAPPGWLEANRKAPGLLAARLECDIRELNPEYVATMLKTVNEAVIPQDVGGVTNRSGWTKAQWQMINPRLARSLVQDDGDASEQMFEKVKSDVGLMFIGQEAKYTKNDPAAQAKLGYVKQVLTANPNYLTALQQGGRFRDLLTKYVDSLQFSLTERDNAKVGAIGVQPDAMENA